MSNYYLILAWIAFFGFLTLIGQMYRTEKVNGKTEWRIHPLWATVLVVPLVIWTANRGYVADTGAYMRMFEELPTSFGEIAGYMSGVEKDRGFYYISAVIKSLITQDVTVYFLILAAVQAYLLFRVYRKYSTRYVLSFFLFIVSTDYVSWMFNGIRQFTAVSITLLAFEYILNKNYVKAIIIVLIASLFHQSALLVIPFIFIVQGKAWNARTLLFIFMAIVIVTSVEQFTGVLDSMLQETQYENVVSDWVEGGDDGTNALRVLVYAVPTIISLIGFRYIKAADNKVINICTNMSIASTGFYFISMFTSGIFIGRLPIYFSLYNYILLPWEIDNMFTELSARLLKVLAVLAYLAFYYYQMHMTWQVV